MSYADLIISLESISCLLSFFGSICVALTWAYPIDNRRKHGRILLLWLSFSDCMSALVYFIQTLNFHQSEVFCKTMALLGIFFPVASFFWTDFIAFYLYLVVVQRNSRLEWTTLLRIFHLTAWGVAAIVILFVAVYNKEGKAETGDDDIIYANTGGWCWISGSNVTTQFIWELIGGKIIEWISCLIVLPYFYISVCLTLRNWDKAVVITTTTTVGPMRLPQPRAEPQPRPLSNSISGAGGSRAIRTISENKESAEAEAVRGSVTSTVDRIVDNNQRTISTATDGSVKSKGSNPSKSRHGDSSFFEESLDRSKYACEDDQESDNRGSSFLDGSESGLKLKSVSGKLSVASISYHNSIQKNNNNNNNVNHSKKGNNDLLPVMVKTTNNNNNNNTNNNGVSSGSSVNQSSSYNSNSLSAASSLPEFSKKKELFSQFYTKLLALPLVFFFIRLWGSIRVIMAVANYKQKSSIQFLAIMQAFFDPSQGFFNAILFVFLSAEDRANLLLSLAVITNYAAAYVPICGRLSTCFASSAVINKEMKRVEKFNSMMRARGESSATNAGDVNVNRSASPSTSSFGGVSFEDESAFDCDPSNRISDFSFESRDVSISTSNQDF